MPNAFTASTAPTRKARGPRASKVASAETSAPDHRHQKSRGRPPCVRGEQAAEAARHSAHLASEGREALASAVRLLGGRMAHTRRGFLKLAGAATVAAAAVPRGAGAAQTPAPGKRSGNGGQMPKGLTLC